MKLNIIAVGLAVTVLMAILFTLPILQSIFGGSAKSITVRTSLSCYLIGFGEVYVSWEGWVGYEWSWNCYAPSDVTIPNLHNVNGTVLGSNRIACRAHYYSVVAQEHIDVQNGTTYTSSTVFTSSSTSTFTTTTTDYQNAGFVTAKTISFPPAAWEVITCTYG